MPRGGGGGGGNEEGILKQLKAGGGGGEENPKHHKINHLRNFEKPTFAKEGLHGRRRWRAGLNGGKREEEKREGEVVGS